MDGMFKGCTNFEISQVLFPTPPYWDLTKFAVYSTNIGMFSGCKYNGTSLTYDLTTSLRTGTNVYGFLAEVNFTNPGTNPINITLTVNDGTYRGVLSASHSSRTPNFGTVTINLAGNLT